MARLTDEVRMRFDGERGHGCRGEHGGGGPADRPGRLFKTERATGPATGWPRLPRVPGTPRTCAA